jgi:DNA-binding LacI/PurR family transcriptional regulator
LAGAAEDRNVTCPHFLEAFCRVANQHGYEVVTFAADEQQSGDVYDDLLRRRAVDAFVLPAAQPFGSHGRSSPRRGVPYVVLGRPWTSEGQRHSWIDVDDEAGTTLAVDHLVACHHRRIAFIGWSRDGRRGDERYKGWLTGIRSHGLPIRGLLGRAEDTVEAAVEVVTRLLEVRDRPTAFVCVSDVAALGASLAIKERQLTVGVDVAVVGFGDTAFSAAVEPELTSVRPSFDVMATDAFQVLTKSLDARRTPKRSNILVPPQLVVRASTQPIDAPAHVRL